MTDNSQQYTLEELWKDLVRDHVSSDQYEADRVVAAIHLLREISNKAKTAASLREKFVFLTNLCGVWQLINSDLMEDFPDIFNGVFSGGNPDLLAEFSGFNEIVLFFTYFKKLTIHNMYRDAFKTWAIILPERVYAEMIEALEAIAAGELPAVLTPRPSKKHKKDLPGWEKARLRACQHVSYLFGEGRTKKSAREIVGTTSGIQVETLRDWETRFRKSASSALKMAHDAGRLARSIQIDNSAERSAHPSILYLMHDLRRETPAGFGAFYKKKFQHKHNPN